MKILGLEFSTLARSVAVLESPGDRLLAETREEAVRGVSPLETVQRTMAAAGVSPGQVDRIAVSLGPGSYTGVRSALAVAQGWTLGRPVEVVGVPVMDILATQALRAGWTGEVALAIDAQKEEIYLAVYKLEGETFRVTTPLQLAPAEAGAGFPILAGPEANRWHPAARLLFPSAATAAILGATREPSPAGKLEPIYLREPTFVKAPRPRVL